MKRIRIKKEIALVWAVTTNGHEEPLEGRNLSLFLVDPKYRKTAKTFHIENGNEVHFRVYPSEQPFTGVYTLELWENLGGQDQTVVDKRSAFELVNFTPQECDGSVDDIHAAEVFIGAGNLAVGIHGRGIVSVTKVSEDPNDWDYRILYDDGATEIIQIARGEKGLTDEEHAELIAETLAAKSAAQSANLAATLAASKAAEAAEAAQTATNAAEAANAAKEAADAATEAAQEATAAANAAKTAANNAATLANNAAANANTKAALAQAAADATNAAIAAASTATAAANAATAAANTAAEAANTAASTANSAASNASAKATLANNAATAANAAKDAANSAASAANAAAALANDAAARAEAAILTIENKIERVELVCEDDQHITRKGSSVALTYDEVKALVDEPKNFVTLRYLDMFWMLPSYDDGGAIMFTSSGIEFGHVVVTRVILNTDGQMNNYSIIAEDADHKTDDMSKETAMDGHMTYPTTHAVNLKLDDLQSEITELDEEVYGKEGELIKIIVDKTDDITTNPRLERQFKRIDTETSNIPSTVIANAALMAYKVEKDVQYEVVIPKVISTTSPIAVIVWKNKTDIITTGASGLRNLVNVNASDKELPLTSLVTAPDNGYIGVSYDKTAGEPIVYKLEQQEGTKGLVERVDNLESKIEPSTDSIFGLNPDRVILPKLMAHKKIYGSTRKSVTIAHCSDMHVVDTTEYARFLEFALHHKELGNIDDIVDTGDIEDTSELTETYDNALDNVKALDGFEQVLCVNGNHDLALSISGNTHWFGALGEKVYNRLFKSHADAGSSDAWGATFPSNHASEYACYYHKDYIGTSDIPTLRAIFIDAMSWNEAEQSWLNNLLAEANTNGYHVAIFVHFVYANRTFNDCDYSTSRGTATPSQTSWNGELYVDGRGEPVGRKSAIDSGTLKSIAENVQAFIDAGGIFCCYVGGHVHYNQLGHLTDYPQQNFVYITSGNKSKVHDFETDIQGMDNFQLVTFNTSDRCVNLLKIGGHYNTRGGNADTYGIRY